MKVSQIATGQDRVSIMIPATGGKGSNGFESFARSLGNVLKKAGYLLVGEPKAGGEVGAVPGKPGEGECNSARALWFCP